MLRFLGRHASLLAFGVVAAVVLGPLTVFWPGAGALAVALLGALGALAAHARATALRVRCDVLSREIDALSKRLLRAEALAAARPEPEQAGLTAEVSDLGVEIGLLSGIVRDLTAVVGAQDAEVARLKAAVARAPVPAPVTVPVTVPMAAPTTTPVPAVVSAPASPPAPAPAGPPVAPRPVLAEPAPPLAARTPAPPLPTAPVRPVPPRAIPPRPEPLPEAALIAAFEGEGLEVHLQPVVTLPQRKVVAYEALARLRAGAELLAPEDFLPVLERHGRTTELDRRMLQRAATVARHLAGRGSEASVTYGLSPLSLYEPGFLRWLARLVDEESGLAGRLVLALPQASWRSLDAEQASALAGLRGKVGFALDRPQDLRFDGVALARAGVGQVKVPAGLLLRPERPDLADIAVEDLVTALARAGIRLVAQAVEAEGDVPDLIDLDVALAQGSVFAAPRPVRADVLAAPPSEAGPPQPPEPEPPQRRPFRSFLRRAS